ncbi:MAG: hypothetical protein IPL46_13635 [Saprospiraceae bacterium]|nr:hypothetical protein [Saprospiraceae bacterium]
MRLLSTIFLLLLILVTSLRDGLVLIGFKINQQYIAQNLCVERNFEESLCHGSCQLKMRLAENHERDQNPAIILLNDQLPVIFFLKITGHTVAPKLLGTLITPNTAQILYFSEYLFKPFRPPK